MVSLRCLSSSFREADDGRGASSTLQLTALTFSTDGTHAAYVVRRRPALPRDGAADPAHCIFIARTQDLNASVPTAGASASSVRPFSDWVVTQVIQGVHTAPITALSWSSSAGGALVSGDADRCVYVWSRQDTGDNERNASASSSSCHDARLFNAVPQLVMLSTEVLLRPTTVAWSVHGSKVYVGTAGGTVAVGRYDVHQRWWICRILLNAQPHHLTSHSPAPHDVHAHTEAMKNTEYPLHSALSFLSSFTAPRDHLIVTVVPHPADNTKVAIALLNGTVQILSTRMKAVDGGVASTPTSKTSDPAGEGEGECSAGSRTSKEPFGHVYWSCSLPCWLHDLSWSPSGRFLAAVGHDSVLHVLHGVTSSPSAASGNPPSGDGRLTHTTLRLRTLPLVRCAFTSDNSLVAAGFEGRVNVFGAAQDGTWHLVAEDNEGEKPPTAAQLDGTGAPPSAMPGATPTHSSQHETNVSVKSRHASDDGNAAVVEVTHNEKSVRQRAAEFMEKSGGLPPAPAPAAGAPPFVRRKASGLTRLLVPLFHAGTTTAVGSTGEKQVRPNTSAFVSANSDGRVQVWCLDSAVPE
ncbi:actin related protein 2/3 complex putative (arpc1) (ARPC1) [Leptomonas pyrrhocoris]|uniref:Arp2/3 complex 41 kDa subunit n=1 Tax=Leptomonas pyrrhocoris TaxID=157538 RepID=A0A0M9FYK9_LEPPY|nr:actin related protein 2/3 complex putative (arpc1) (ARPC1) [Leptomonas pyrrhocoris]XP_015657018.1 actin related protein 2/3 complex putative (arpc1) (ARPC1) [Leptomonas pyrrhocoris]KPA78573.1 actin related protein 2/3 complex putative (arpc1) (ARPC1) [Leptomonas pyrrhocoris]KPA78579.1 actin related protein 2/3 complex putative (arpc1) (ARPC1) [Leptomonas pyrrhocoris]|eukprot:XP_015657012.1 actin related protein 2/3 complex putative (arpc1) (ARPC1) [Leptomonas pyrrhocoris]